LRICHPSPQSLHLDLPLFLSLQRLSSLP
jgi:hypothetical protein